MKIAIISDTHDNLATLDKFLTYTGQNPLGIVIHCGDIASGDTLQYLAKRFDGKIWAVLGNMDYCDSVIAAAKNFPEKVILFENFGQLKLGGLNIGFCHHKEMALSRAQGNSFDFVFYGHTHKPWQETVNSCQLVNPGNLAGMMYQATFALLDSKTKKLELKIIDRL